MRTKRSSNSNMRFLKGNVLFFALLLLAIMLFVYYSVEEMDVQGGNEASCRISFAADYNGGECEVFVDDNLLYTGVPLPVDSQLVTGKFL